MTYLEVATALMSVTVGTNQTIPCAYMQFPEDGTAPEPPFMVYYFDYSEDFLADNVNYAPIRHIVVELYTNTKDFTTESAVESHLTSNGFVFSKTEDYIESERLYMVTYNTEVTING